MAAHVQANEEHEKERVLLELVRQNAEQPGTATAIRDHVKNL